MTIKKKYTCILIISVFIWAIISCNDSDSTNTSDERDAAPALNKTKPTVAKSANSSNFNLPEGYKLFEKIQGDLNGDGLSDYVLVIKGTKKENFVKNDFDEVVDRNRRGVMIYWATENGVTLAAQNLDCFSSENEDGGVYFPPELSINIKKGKLYIGYGHGRYGNWQYTFRYQNAAFELIGYDSNENNGPIINYITSINFLTQKKQTKVNVNEEAEASGEEVFEEKWDKITVDGLHKLSEINDFDDLDVTKSPTPSNIQITNESGTTPCLLKDIVVDNGAYYVIVDYTQITGEDESSGVPIYENRNPKLRTFKLDINSEVSILEMGVQEKKIHISEKDKDELVNYEMWDIEVKNGTVISLSQVYFP